MPAAVSKRRIQNAHITIGSSALQLSPEERYVEPVDIRDVIEKRRRQQRVAKNRARMQALSLQQCVMYSVAACLIAVTCLLCVAIHANSTQMRRNIRMAGKQIQEIQMENEILETRLTSEANLEYVYMIATRRLGMVYPTSENIIYFESCERGYVYQREDIPTSD